MQVLGFGIVGVRGLGYNNALRNFRYKDLGIPSRALVKKKRSTDAFRTVAGTVATLVAATGAVKPERHESSKSWEVWNCLWPPLAGETFVQQQFVA